MSTDELSQALAAKLARLDLLEQLYAQSQERNQALIVQSTRLAMELAALKAKMRDEETPEYVTKGGVDMPHCFVLQPSGKWAIYSTITDTLTAFNLTADEALEDEMRWNDSYPGGKDAYRRDLLKEMAIVRETGRAWDWGRTWVEAIGQTLFHQGDDVEIVRLALESGAISAEDYAAAQAYVVRARAECGLDS